MRSAGCVIGSIVPLVTSSRPADVNVTMPLKAMVHRPIARSGGVGAEDFLKGRIAKLQDRARVQK